MVVLWWRNENKRTKTLKWEDMWTTLTLWEKKERKTPKETSVAEESERKKKTGRQLNPNHSRTVKGTLYWFSASFHNWHLKAITNLVEHFLNQLFKKKFHMILQMWYLSRPQPLLSSVFFVYIMQFIPMFLYMLCPILCRCIKYHLILSKKYFDAPFCFLVINPLHENDFYIFAFLPKQNLHFCQMVDWDRTMPLFNNPGWSWFEGAPEHVLIARMTLAHKPYCGRKERRKYDCWSVRETSSLASTADDDQKKWTPVPPSVHPDR